MLYARDVVIVLSVTIPSKVIKYVRDDVEISGLY